MPADAEFRPAILADRADDAPRLVYADWLDETGADPSRARYVRLGCRTAGREVMAGTLPPGTDKAIVQARAAERELLRQNWRRWWPDLPGAVGIETGTLRVVGVTTGRLPREWRMDSRRGFIEHFAGTLGDWETWARDRLAAEPLLSVAFVGSFRFHQFAWDRGGEFRIRLLHHTDDIDEAARPLGHLGSWGTWHDSIGAVAQFCAEQVGRNVLHPFLRVDDRGFHLARHVRVEVVGL